MRSRQKNSHASNSPKPWVKVPKWKSNRGSDAGHSIPLPLSVVVLATQRPRTGSFTTTPGLCLYHGIGRQLHILALRSLYGWRRDLVDSLCSVPRHEALEPSPLLEAPSHSTSLLLFIYCVIYRCITSIINPDRGFPLPTSPFPSSNNFPWVSWQQSCGTDPTHVHRLSRRQPGQCLSPSWSPWLRWLMHGPWSVLPGGVWIRKGKWQRKRQVGWRAVEPEQKKVRRRAPAMQHQL